MKNNQPIVIEIVSAVEILCRQVNSMRELTGRDFSLEHLQILIDARVEEFKTLYPEIPKDSKFSVENLSEGLLYINTNQAFRDYVEEVEKQAIHLNFEFSNVLH